MPGSDWIGRGRVGRVGSRRLGRGLEPACAGKGPSRVAAPAPNRVPPAASGGVVARVTECCRSSPPCLAPRKKAISGFRRVDGEKLLLASQVPNSPWA